MAAHWSRDLLNDQFFNSYFFPENVIFRKFPSAPAEKIVCRERCGWKETIIVINWVKRVHGTIRRVTLMFFCWSIHV
jgi:hypothetical protein